MDKIIRLTGPEGNPTCIKVKDISGIQVAENYSCRIFLRGGQTITVRESADYVARWIWDSDGPINSEDVPAYKKAGRMDGNDPSDRDGAPHPADSDQYERSALDLGAKIFAMLEALSK